MSNDFSFPAFPKKSAICLLIGGNAPTEAKKSFLSFVFLNCKSTCSSEYEYPAKRCRVACPTYIFAPVRN